MKIISDPYQVDKKEWSDFVLNHPNGNIFHTPEMVELYGVDPKSDPIVIAISNQNGQLVGLLVGVILKEYKSIIGTFTSRAIVWGGPLALSHDNEIFDQLLNRLNSICKNKKVVFAQFRNLWQISNWDELFEQQGYKFDEHLDILFNLQLGENILWKGMNPTRRKQVTRGLARGIHPVIVNSLNKDELNTCYDILKLVYTDARLPYPKIEYFQNSIQIMREKGYFKAALALYNNDIVGFRFLLCFNGLIYDWYAGSKKEHYDKYPNDILPWSIMQWGIVSGCHTFDFGGAGKPGVKYGVRDYKLKFGGELVNYGRYEKIFRPVVYKLVSNAFIWWRKAKTILK